MSGAGAQTAREEVLAYLAERSPLAQTAATIRRRLAEEHAVSEEQVRAALPFLEDLGLVTHETAAFGSERYWKATAQGVLHYERGERA